MADHEKAMLCYMGGWLSASIPHQTKASVVPLLLRMLPFFASTAMSDQDRRLTKQPIVDKQFTELILTAHTCTTCTNGRVAHMHKGIQMLPVRSE